MLKEEIQLIHEGPFRLVFVSSGGGSKAISDLLKVPGASQTILECHIPYSRESMDEYLNFKPSHYCGLQTTVNMAVMAFSRAKKLSTETKPENLIGVAVTATLSTTYEKLGSHRFFICIELTKIPAIFIIRNSCIAVTRWLTRYWLLNFYNFRSKPSQSFSTRWTGFILTKVNHSNSVQAVNIIQYIIGGANNFRHNALHLTY